MNKNQFIYEVNLTIKDINLKDSEIEYIVKDTSNLPELSGNTVAAIGIDTSEITITYKGKTKKYEAGHGTTFPCEFIEDYKKGFYS